MQYLFDIEYENYREDIRMWREMGKDWESIKYAQGGSEEQLLNYLNFCSMRCLAPLTVDEWFILVNEMKGAEEDRLVFVDQKGAGIIYDPNLDSNVKVPVHARSMWKLYQKKLEKKGFKEETIASIRDSAYRTLKRTSKDTTEISPIKGMVVGNVQSGKTANMAALMAMACDNGWNMFIILSGCIENLRKQTEDRIYNDLKNDSCNLNWNPIKNPSKKSPNGSKLSDLNFREDSRERYFTVCLKNSTRLKNLLEWLHEDENKYKDMKIIIIDDEADQAGINTATMDKKTVKEIYDERKKINRAIVDLVEGKYKNKQIQARAMNYICYTATPYANFLNEFNEESLYPKSFINFIDPSKEYFGPQEIFGVLGNEKYEGLPIVRKIEDFDHDNLKNTQTLIMPKSFYESFYYFLCAAASMRYYQNKGLMSKQPASMLIHISQRQADHLKVQLALEEIVANASMNLNETLKICEGIWNKESNEFTREDLVETIDNYYESIQDLNDYPKFEEIRDIIVEILSVETTNIMLGEDREKIYHKGLHICVDNCKNNVKATDEVHLRLAYPEKIDDENLAPIFIVIGGSTLSRGLTIDGLVTTYFLRTVKQADTLMQMGRWFGYRKGYEVLQRLWLSEDAKEKFEFLSELDLDLRNELRRFRDGGLSPSQYGPHIKNSPKVSWLAITSKKKMQAAKEVEFDFSGYAPQTIVFNNDKDIMLNNISNTERLFKKLGQSKVSHNNRSLYWENVDFDNVIKEYLLSYKSPVQAKAFNEMPLLIDWLQQLEIEHAFTKWNVVLGASKFIDNEDIEEGKYWIVDGHKVANSNYSKLIDKNGDRDNLIKIKVLRVPEHLCSDVDLENIDEDEKIRYKDSSDIARNYRELRDKAGLSHTPLLIIYRINKYYEYRHNKRKNLNRENMNALEDMIGLSIIIPGSNKNHAKKIAISIPKDNLDEDYSYEN